MESRLQSSHCKKVSNIRQGQRIDHGKRYCSNCGSNKTYAVESGHKTGDYVGTEGKIFLPKSPYELWYQDGRGGWLCNRCTGRRRYYDRRAGNETKYSCFTSKDTYQKLRLLRFHKERYGATLTRVVDYYVKNCLDSKTRKELIEKVNTSMN